MRGSGYAGWKRRSAIALDGVRGTVFVTFFVLLSLFMDDIRLAVLSPAHDLSCEVISGIILVRAR